MYTGFESCSTSCDRSQLLGILRAIGGRAKQRFRRVKLTRLCLSAIRTGTGTGTYLVGSCDELVGCDCSYGSCPYGSCSYGFVVIRPYSEHVNGCLATRTIRHRAKNTCYNNHWCKRCNTCNNPCFSPPPHSGALWAVCKGSRATVTSVSPSYPPVDLVANGVGWGSFCFSSEVGFRTPNPLSPT